VPTPSGRVSPSDADPYRMNADRVRAWHRECRRVTHADARKAVASASPSHETEPMLQPGDAKHSPTTADMKHRTPSSKAHRRRQREAGRAASCDPGRKQNATDRSLSCVREDWRASLRQSLCRSRIDGVGDTDTLVAPVVGRERIQASEMTAVKASSSLWPSRLRSKSAVETRGRP